MYPRTIWDQFLLEFARERGLTVTYAQDEEGEDFRGVTYPNILRPQLSRSRVHYLHTFVDATDGNYIVPQPATMRFWPPVEEDAPVELSDVFVFPTLTKALRVLLDEAVERGIVAEWFRSVDIALTLRADEGTNYVVSILTNADLVTSGQREPKPTLEEIHQAGEVLGVSEPPRWYVDRDDFDWQDQCNKPPEFWQDEHEYEEGEQEV